MYCSLVFFCGGAAVLQVHNYRITIIECMHCSTSYCILCTAHILNPYQVLTQTCYCILYICCYWTYFDTSFVHALSSWVPISVCGIFCPPSTSWGGWLKLCPIWPRPWWLSMVSYCIRYPISSQGYTADWYCLPKANSGAFMCVLMCCGDY